MTDEVYAALVRIAGPNVRIAVENVACADGLMGLETDAVGKAIPKRQAEFAAGRRAARKALNLRNVAIPAGADRAPIWPADFVGAITHDDRLAIAIVGRAAECLGIGVDVAEAAPFPSHLRERVLLTPEERALDGLEARAAFSAKETLYKTLYPRVQKFFGFEAATIKTDLAANSFTATLTADLGQFPSGSTFHGGVEIVGPQLFTTMVLPR